MNLQPKPEAQYRRTEFHDPMEHATPLSHIHSAVEHTHDRPQDEQLSANHALTDGMEFAIFDLNNFQYKVLKDDVVMVPNLKDNEIGDALVFKNVLLVGSNKWTLVGRPLVASAEVHAVVEEHTRTEKVLAFKFKRRKGYKKLKGHRSMVSMLRITDIKFDAEEAVKQTEQQDQQSA